VQIFKNNYILQNISGGVLQRCKKMPDQRYDGTQKVIIGFLDNLSFERTPEISKMPRIEPRVLRKNMCKTLEDILHKSRVPFLGPSTNVRYPLGGYFFKMALPDKERSIKRAVFSRLKKLEPLTILIDGYKEQTMELGFVVKSYAHDKYPDSIIWCETDVLELASHVSALARARKINKENRPYFKIVNKQFLRNYPVDSDLDNT
jgi:hypothetical protein